MKKKRVKHKLKSKKKKPMKKHWKILIIVIAILLILVVGFFTIRTIKRINYSKGFFDGANYGYVSTIYTIMNMSLSCQPIPLYVGNTTIDMIAVDCLQPPTG